MNGALPLADLLARIAGELRDLAAGVEDANVLGALSATSPRAAVTALQSLDATRQSLEALADVVDRCATVCPPGSALDPARHLADLPLAALASRLAGQAPARAEPGDLLLF
jgi:hypothetical protein